MIFIRTIATVGIREEAALGFARGVGLEHAGPDASGIAFQQLPSIVINAVCQDGDLIGAGDVLRLGSSSARSTSN
ncbi:hypothetical protein [Novosphingobium sp. AAP83]|uniref:hypothetical protein n=1 Tax=Novosphingobium sp. AAP83 TaxID=1523425 RepID=UPI000B268AA3|nr:hypothetical protein [Novosphingobium sp. AAP83]